MRQVLTMSEITQKRKRLKISQIKIAEILKVDVRTFRIYEKKNDIYVHLAEKCTDYLKMREDAENI